MGSDDFNKLMAYKIVTDKQKEQKEKRVKKKKKKGKNL
jgi:hypothetical protein